MNKKNKLNFNFEMEEDLNTNIPLNYFLLLEERARHKLIKRYNKPLSYHDVKIINDILYNEKTHYVEQFKEYLIYEDYNEFLKRFYKSFEISIKLPKILFFYDKYSKIYANYTVIPESRYMYKNIKRKQKMIDQMQNNNNYSDYEEDEESNEDISNTVFSSRVINSIYNRTLTTLNKSEAGGNTEQSINDFINKINVIENNAQKNLKNNNYINNNRNNEQKSKNNSKYSLIDKQKTTKVQNVSENKNINNELKNKISDVQLTHSRKVIKNQNQNPNNHIKQNISNTNNSNTNSRMNINSNLNNGTNIIFISSYISKSKNNANYFKNNNSIGNNTLNNYTYNNNSNTFNGYKNVLKPNLSFSKKKLATALLKQNVINNSSNLINHKENMNITNINKYFSNIHNFNNQQQKYKLSLGETLLKLDKIILSTNTSNSPKIIKDKMFTPTNSKLNIFKDKKQKIMKEKENNNKNKKNLKNKVGQALSSYKVINPKNLKSQFLSGNTYIEKNMNYLSNKYIENCKLKNITNKSSKKKINKKINNYQHNDLNNNNAHNSKDKENCSNNEEISNIYKKPESHRNYCYSQKLSINNTNSKNRINNNNNHINKNKISTALKYGTKQNSQKIISTPCSPNSSSTNFFFKSNAHSRKDSINTMDKNTKKNNLNENNKKKKVVNTFNIVNNIHDNSTQINIYTGNNLYRSLHFQNNSVFNSSNITPANTSKSPIVHGGNIKYKKNLCQGNKLSNNTIYFNSNNKGKDPKVNYNLDLKKIINKPYNENEKALISARQINNKNLFEKIGNYFLKKKNEKNVNYKNYMSNKNINVNKNNQNSYNNIINNNKNIKNNNDYLINKIINKKSNSNNILLKNKTNNNTPTKNKYVPLIAKNHRKISNPCLSQKDNEQLTKINKATSRHLMNYKKLIGNLNDLKKIGIDDGTKFLIHSERNKISKIVFK